MKIAVLGGTGQLGRALKCVSTDNTDHDISFYTRAHCDLSQDIRVTEKFIEGLQDVDAIIIAAAYTAVDAAEADQATAFRVNGDAPTAIAKICAARGISLVHVSTDYVFNGQATAPYQPEHTTNPLNVYGMSKRAGEVGILASGARAVILRTTWVFDGTGKNFMTTMLKLSESHAQLSVVDDQMGRPTYAGDLAAACLRAAEAVHEDAARTGIYHVSGSGEPISWASFAVAVFARADKILGSSVTVNRVTSKEFPTVAARPKYSVLDISTFEKTFDLGLPTWEKGLDKAFREFEIRGA